MSSYSGLLSNTMLLLALGVIYDTLGLYKINQRLIRTAISGMLIGLLGITVMLTPWQLAPGIIFDTRWVLISLCALFFGAGPTLIAVAMTVTFRLYLGGTGAFVGSLVIIVAAIIGLAWRKLEHKRNWKLNWLNLYLFGFAVQLAILACMLLMPATVRFNLIYQLTPPLLSIFPIGTMLLGLVLRRQRDRRASELELAEHRRLLDRERGLLRALIDSIPDGIFFKDAEGNYLGCNKAFEELIGATEQSLVGKTGLDMFDEETAQRIQQQDQKVVSSGKPMNIEEWTLLPGDRFRMMSTRKAPFRGLDGTTYGLAGITRDITDQFEAHHQQRRLEEQLHQSQKIESLGRLAGGVAHDYNNMLSVIIGNVELAQIKAERSAPVKDNLAQILQAANRSRDITRQLLAFARKQIINPKVLDLNAAVEDMLKMLRNLLGENIDLGWKPGEDLWPVRMDPSQLDQVLANLCINARDAIADVGKMTIETDRVNFDEEYCNNHQGFVAGDYVMLAVSDNGCGMDRETLKNIFEPFFTTKQTGEGTGLGMATVYGIVKQSNGFINVYSEPDLGTTFKIYLPRCDEGVNSKEAAASQIQKGRGETVLLVEDEVAIVQLATAMLEDLGYRVLAANSPAEALSLAEIHQGEIQLLLTDVVMPDMNGRDLAKQIQGMYPGIKALYMSGYTANVIAHHGVLDEGINFIQKPFARNDLSIRIREVLDS